MVSMNEKITIDQVEKMLWEVTQYKIDQSQADAFKVLVETLVLEKAGLWKKAPTELIEAHMETLVTLARQLLDTGGRMRLHPEGQLDVPENPVATRADVEALGRKIIDMDGDLKVLAEAKPEPFDPTPLYLATRFGLTPGQAEELPAWSADVLAAAKLTAAEAETFYEEDEDPAEVFAAFDKGEKFVTAPPADEIGVAPVLDDETRDAIAEVLKPRRRRSAELNPDGTLTCRDCGVAKPVTEYFINKKSKVGYETKCKTCRSAKAA